jgi:hypothetical protein
MRLRGLDAGLRRWRLAGFVTSFKVNLTSTSVFSRLDARTAVIPNLIETLSRAACLRNQYDFAGGWEVIIQRARVGSKAAQ